MFCHKIRLCLEKRIEIRPNVQQLPTQTFLFESCHYVITCIIYVIFCHKSHVLFQTLVILLGTIRLYVCKKESTLVPIYNHYNNMSYFVTNVIVLVKSPTYV